MKKFLIAVIALFVIGGGVFFYIQHKKDDEMLPVTPSGNGSSSNTPTPSSASATYKDGSYTGITVQTDRGYGPVQVQAVVSGGKITDIVFLQMPSGFGHTQEVTTAAEPLLKQEAIAAQSATVDIVSGATQDSLAFQESLASALTQAK